MWSRPRTLSPDPCLTRYAKGKYAPQDLDESQRWCALAANQGHQKAQIILKRMENNYDFMMIGQAPDGSGEANKKPLTMEEKKLRVAAVQAMVEAKRTEQDMAGSAPAHETGQDCAVAAAPLYTEKARREEEASADAQAGPIPDVDEDERYREGASEADQQVGLHGQPNDWLPAGSTIPTFHTGSSGSSSSGSKNSRKGKGTRGKKGKGRK